MLDVITERWTRRLAPGARLTFGRGGPGVDEVVADDPRLHRRCGTIVVTDTGWELTNDGRWLRLRVRSLDRSGSDDLLPGQSIVVPWDAARVELHAGPVRHDLVVRWVGARPQRAPAAIVDDSDDRTSVPVRVDRETAYFRALVALCEPQLRDPTSIDVATDLEIARRLNRAGGEPRRVSGKTVERRLDACRTHFGLKASSDDGGGAGLEVRDARRRLVELALLTGTVTVGDLALLAAEPAERGPLGPVTRA